MRRPWECVARCYVSKSAPRPANTSRLEAVLGQGGEAPSDGTSLLLTSAHTGGSGTRAEQVALGSEDRIRRGRAPHLKYKYLSGSSVQSVDRASEYFRRVAKETDSSWVRGG